MSIAKSRRREFPAPTLLHDDDIQAIGMALWQLRIHAANTRPIGHCTLGKTVGVYRCYGAIRSQTKVASLEK